MINTVFPQSIFDDDVVEDLMCNYSVDWPQLLLVSWLIIMVCIMVNGEL